MSIIEKIVSGGYRGGGRMAQRLYEWAYFGRYDQGLLGAISDFIYSSIRYYGEMLAAVLYVLAAVSIIKAFFGYKLTRIWIVISGIFVGAGIGGALGALLGVTISMDAVPFMAILGVLIGGVLGGYLAYKFWKVGIFLTYFNLSFFVLFCLGLIQGASIGVAIFIGLIGGIFAGYLAVKIAKPMIIIITSVFNGFLAGFYGVLLFGDFLGIVLGLICVIGGFIFQCRNNGNVFGIGKGKIDLSALSGAAEKAKDAALLAADKAGEVAGKAAAAVEEKKSDLLSEKVTSQPAEQSDGRSPQKLSSVSPVSDTTGNLQMRNSKLRGDLTVSRIRTRNDRELWMQGVPVVIPQMQIADVDEAGNIGLYLSIQNIQKKQVVAVYFDIVCSNVLKEQIAVLRDVPILDMAIDCGKVQPLETYIALPDTSIRRCELFLKYVVFSDESIWKQEGEVSLQMVEEQEQLHLPQGLSEEFKKEVYRLTGHRSGEFPYMPRSGEADTWFCGCGQLNVEEQCVCCGIRRQEMFTCVDEEHLTKLYQETQEKRAREEAERRRMEEEMRLREEERQAQLQREKEAREAERRRKLEELQGKTKNMLDTAVGMGQSLAEKAGNLGKNTGTSSQKTIFCGQCGSENEADAMFCSECGEPLK